MRILLIAYDFPPVPSPQSLRWTYLVRELYRLGHQVQVIAPDVAGYGPGGLPAMPEGIEVHRVYPGWFSQWVSGGLKRKAASVAPEARGDGAQPALVERESWVATPEVLNWKGRVRKYLESYVSSATLGLLRLLLRGLGGSNVQTAQLNWKGCAAEIIKLTMSRRRFPDYRAEWVSHARPVLDRVVAEFAPDLAVVSHEPACALPLAFSVGHLGVPWVADLGDPILAPYTPPRWYGYASKLERDICTQAGFVSVTTEAAAQLLAKRHGQPADRFLVITQGYDSSFTVEQAHRQVTFDSETLELLYTGSFYDFRRADVLIRAVEETPRVRLTVATIAAPDYLKDAAERSPAKFRLVGFLPHVATLAAQRECDVLVNLANDDPVQVPGKVYEYLGAGRPMLHIRADCPDNTGQLLERLGAGWDMPADEQAISELLASVRDAKASGGKAFGSASPESTREYSWQLLAAKWATHASDLVAGRKRGIAS